MYLEPFGLRGQVYAWLSGPFNALAGRNVSRTDPYTQVDSIAGSEGIFVQVNKLDDPLLSFE